MEKMKYYFLWISTICIIVFAIQSFIPGFTDVFILDERANNLEVWRYLTAIFLHENLTHLFYNLVALLFFGLTLEKLAGSRKFLSTFLISGILANLIAINYYDSSLGASGAIYGVIGFLIIIRPFMFVWTFGLLMPLFLASIVWVIGDILMTQGAFGQTNIGAIAHISGIIIGLIIGFVHRIKNKPLKNDQVRISFDELRFKEWEDNYLK